MKIKVVEYVEICGTLALNYILMIPLPLANDTGFSKVSWMLFICHFNENSCTIQFWSFYLICKTCSP